LLPHKLKADGLVYQPQQVALSRCDVSPDTATQDRCAPAGQSLRIQAIIPLRLSPISRTLRAYGTTTSCPTSLSKRRSHGERIPVLQRDTAARHPAEHLAQNISWCESPRSSATVNFWVVQSLLEEVSQKCKCGLANASTRRRIVHSTAQTMRWGLFLRLASSRACNRTSSSSSIRSCSCSGNLIALHHSFLAAEAPTNSGSGFTKLGFTKQSFPPMPFGCKEPLFNVARDRWCDPDGQEQI
jgi:hypothetical protein